MSDDEFEFDSNDDFEFSPEENKEIEDFTSIPKDELTKAQCDRINELLTSHGLSAIDFNANPDVHIAEPSRSLSPLTAKNTSSKRVQCIPPTSSIKKRKRFTRTFRVIKSEERPEKFTGKNTMFNEFRSSFFLLHLNKKFRIITNNRKLRDFTCITDRKHPSYNYVISCFINGLFRFFNFYRHFSEALCNKYYNIVCHHMHEQLAAIK